MGATINNAIYSVAAFHHTDATKSRAKELIHELSSDERELLISILNKTFDPTTNCQALADKLIAIHEKDATDAFTPIAHEKDKDRSTCDKIWMNVWRTIKDIFGARISDGKLIKEINAFSMQEALESLTEVDTIYQSCPKNPPEHTFYDFLKFKISNSHYYDIDLTTTKCGHIFKQDFSTLKKAIANEILEGLGNNGATNIEALQGAYSLLLASNEFNDAFSGKFGVFQSLSLRNIIENIDRIGFENLSDHQKLSAYQYIDLASCYLS